ncbi:probable RNA-binding protein 18 [Littorina saxatilis]|uniref:Probable RNA-binding protein 18 n=1 Tax=Littorina saxatilis TaxID=31220 RepID=A0AAN9AW99_9CAEN
MTTLAQIPVPVQSDEKSVNDRRLWIGNLDHRITEYVLLKLVQKFGTPERFDFMYHVNGPEKGRPKGYCFVTYPNKEMAARAIRALNGKMALTRRLIVHWAKEKYDADPLPSSSSSLTSKAEETASEASTSDRCCTESKIRAIEAKLSVMEETKKDFGLSELPAAPPGTNRYSSVNTVQKTQPYNKDNRNNSRGPYSHRKPFEPRGRRR